MGWTDLGCYGSDFYETPHVDRLAKEGMKFTDAYAASCVCSPTRVSILTGKYPGRLHITHAIPIQGAERIKEPLPLIEAIYKKNLPLEEVTIAEALKAGGYATATMGKWHVCWDREFYPKHQGFDLNVGGNNMGNPGNYFFPYNGKWRMTPKHPYTRWNTLPDGRKGEYLTDRLTDEAEAYIERNKDRPFFLYLSYYSVHTPLQAPKKRVAKYEKKPAGKRHSNATYAAMVESVDLSVGRIMRRLEKLGLTKNTVVIFTSDHGHLTGQHGLYGKGNTTIPQNLYQDSINIPLIVYGPKHLVVPGQVRNEFVNLYDVFPTLVEVINAGPHLKNYDGPGKSWLPLLGGDRVTAFRNFQFAEYGNARMAHNGRWKLVRYYQKDAGSPPQDYWYDL